MKIVSAWQMIYGNVEEEDSPKRTRGFQTLRLSKAAGIDAAELAALEARLVYASDAANPVKRVFHVTRSGKILLAQAIGVPGRDREGRTGRYLAHGLVFDAGRLRDLATSIFAIFRQFDFLTDMDRALDAGDRITGDIESVHVKADAEDLQGAASVMGPWDPAEFKRLSLLALRANSLAAERQIVLFVGLPEEVESAIQAAFSVLPDALAMRCTFDTYFEGCNPVGTYYWGVGLAKPSGSIRFIEVDAHARRVVSRLPLEPATCYERWVAACVDSDCLRERLDQREAAFTLCEWLEGREDQASQMQQLEQNPALIETVFGANPQQLRSRLGDELTRQFSPRLAERVLDLACTDYLTGSAVEVFRRLRKPFARERTYDLLLESCRRNDWRQPDRSELNELVRLQDLPPDLSLMAACWTGREDRIESELGSLEPEKYRNFLEFALQKCIGDPLSLLIASRASEYVQVYLADRRLRKAPPAALLGRLADVGRLDLASPEVVDLVCQILRREGIPRPTKKELDAYRPLVRRGHHRPLSLWVACWDGREEEIEQELETFEAGSYQALVSEALRHGIGDPLGFLVHRWAKQYVWIYVREPDLQRVSISEIVGRLLAIGRSDCLTELTPLLKGLSRQELLRIRRQAKTYAHERVPDDFSTTLNERLAATAPWWESLLKAWRNPRKEADPEEPRERGRVSKTSEQDSGDTGHNSCAMTVVAILFLLGIAYYFRLDLWSLCGRLLDRLLSYLSGGST